MIGNVKNKSFPFYTCILSFNKQGNLLCANKVRVSFFVANKNGQVEVVVIFFVPVDTI